MEPLGAPATSRVPRSPHICSLAAQRNRGQLNHTVKNSEHCLQPCDHAGETAHGQKFERRFFKEITIPGTFNS